MFVATASGPVGRSGLWMAVCVLFSLASGCAANHAFVRGVALDVPALASELQDQPQDDRGLYEITYIPLTYLDAQIFVVTEDTKDYPKGHTLFSVRSWLPLFGVVDADVERYDAENSAYERSDFTSVLWGLWTGKRGIVQTTHGARSERTYRLFWFLDWGPRVHYERAAAD